MAKVVKCGRAYLSHLSAIRRLLLGWARDLLEISRRRFDPGVPSEERLVSGLGDGETEDQARKTISVTRNDRYMCFEGNQGGSAELGG